MAEEDDITKFSKDVGRQLEQDVEKDDPRPPKTEADEKTGGGAGQPGGS